MQVTMNLLAQWALYVELLNDSRVTLGLLQIASSIIVGRDGIVSIIYVCACMLA